MTLDKLTLTQLLETYGRIVWAISLHAGQRHDADLRNLEAQKALLEAEARRRDQATWMPAAKEVKREENGDIVFA